MKTKIGVRRNRHRIARIASLFAVVLAGSCGVVWGQIPRSGGLGDGARYQLPPAIRANDDAVAASKRASDRAAAERLKQQQHAQLQKAQTQALLRERQAVIDQVYSRFPRPIDSRNRIVDDKLVTTGTDTLGETMQADVFKVLTNGLVVTTFTLAPMYGSSSRSVETRNYLGQVTSSRIVPTTVEVGTEKVTGKQIILKNFGGGLPCTEGEKISCRAVRIGTTAWEGNTLQVWDCGLPDTAENRTTAGIPIPTPDQIAAASEGIAAGIQALADQKLAAKAQASDAKAEARKAAQGKVFATYREQAQAGDGLAQLRLGEMYLRGEGVEANTMLARQWLSAALTNGYAQASRLLAEIESAGSEK